MYVTLNLTKGLNPYPQYSSLGYKYFSFPSGEPGFQLDAVPSRFGDSIIITTRLATPDDIVKLMLATDALGRAYLAEGILEYRLELFISFMGFARQDKLHNRGEAHSLWVLAELINRMNFDRVMVFEPHSDITTALIDRSIAVSSIKLAMNYVHYDTVVVAVDFGAVKRLAKYQLREDYLLICNKKRDPSNGNIIQHDLLTQIPQDAIEFLIIDDICDGGATFISVAKAIRQQVSNAVITLYVPHGIFSKSVDHLIQGGIDHIITTNSFKEQEPHGRLTQIYINTNTIGIE
jgi:ribose-phosphate pyrophosphokinase